MKHLKRYGKWATNEAASAEDLGALGILRCIQDLVDEYPVRLFDAKGNSVAPADVYKNSSDAEKFSVTNRFATLFRSHFKVAVYLKTFDELCHAFSEMQVSKERFKEHGFAMVNLKIDDNGMVEPNEITFRAAVWTFERPDEMVGDDVSLEKELSREDIKKEFGKKGLYVEDIAYLDDVIEVEFDPQVSPTTGQYLDADDKLHAICVAIGATRYDAGRSIVSFFFRD